MADIPAGKPYSADTIDKRGKVGKPPGDIWTGWECGWIEAKGREGKSGKRGGTGFIVLIRTNISDGCFYPGQKTKFQKSKNCPIDWMIFGRLRS